MNFMVGKIRAGCAAALIALSCAAAHGQQQAGAPLTVHSLADLQAYAVARQERDFVTIIAKAPCPIRQAVAALRRTFQWKVDFEEAPVDAVASLAEDKTPEWRAAHPNDPRFFSPRDGFFMSYAPGDKATLATDAGKEAALKKLVDDYNASGYPGTYALKTEGPGRFAIVGSVEGGSLHYPEGESLLDTLVSVGPHKGMVWDSVRPIVSAVAKATGTPLKWGSVPRFSILALANSPGGTGVTARQLLVQALDAGRWPQAWEMTYDPNPPGFTMHIHVIGKDKQGEGPYDPID